MDINDQYFLEYNKTTPAKIVNTWLEALRSGEYIKGGDALRTPVRTEHTYCALGVLVDVCPNKIHIRKNFSFIDETVSKFTGLKCGWGTGGRGHKSLVELNDSGMTFTEIADYVEQIGLRHYFHTIKI